MERPLDLGPDAALAPPPSDDESPAPFGPLLQAVRQLVRCDAVALLQLDGEVLVPVATDGLSEEILGRRLPVAAHPRLAAILARREGLRFEPDCDLPDPFDGLVDGFADSRADARAGHRTDARVGALPGPAAVHDCAGTPLYHDGRPWGLLTLDALDTDAFAHLPAQQLPALARLVESSIASHARQRALAERAERERLRGRALHLDASRRELLVRSAAMRALAHEIDAVAGTDLTTLIQGETGTGKELVARRLHARSRRRAQPLVTVNCAALPEGLAESELFGHKRGAFTGALADRPGRFELADGGTLLLDEVGELPLPLQAKLLRVLQEGELQRPGSDRPVRVDVRVIAATNRDLLDEVERRRFRADLYHRLAAYPLRVPPLRERGADVLALAGGFLEENQHQLGSGNLRLSPAARLALRGYDWPGNVRELEHVIARAALRAVVEQGRSARWIAIDIGHLGLAASAAARTPAAIAPGAVSLPPADGSVPDDPTASEGGGLREATDAFQRAWIVAALQRHEGSVAQAARDAAMDRSNFQRLARRLGVPTAGRP